MFYFETFRIILQLKIFKSSSSSSNHLQSKNKATLGNASNSKPKDYVTQKITEWRKRRQKQSQDRQPCRIP